MKTNKLILSIMVMSACFSITAQTSFDAAKIYEEDLNGTARYVGMGGAMSAFGSDPSVISHNPAGIATYRKNDINTSLSFFGTSVNTDPLYTSRNQGKGSVGGDDAARYYYSNNIKSDIRVSFDNISVIFSGSGMGSNYLNFGFSYRKILDTDRNLDYLDKYYVKDKDDPEQKYVLYREYGDHQRNKVNSYDFNLSYNLSDKLYLGWTIGILSTDTWSEGFLYDYYPSESQASVEDKDYIAYYDKQHDYTAVDKMNSAQGSGWNMSFGAILRPIPALRLGVAVKTPTYFKQELVYEDCLYAINDVEKDGKTFSKSTDYKFTSPWSLNLSAGLTIAHTAIGLEYEKHFTQRSSLSVGNTRMTKQGAVDFKDYSTFKLGIEQNIGNLSLRAGYNYTGPMFNEGSYPYLYDTEFNGWGYDKDDNLVVGRFDYPIDRMNKKQYYTLGLGYCSAPDYDGTQFYFDLAYVHGVKKSVFNLNEYVEDIDVNYNYKSDKLMFTIGWNF